MSHVGYFNGRPIKKDWRDRLTVGDVLWAQGGDLRAVRSVTYRKSGHLLALCLVIRRCSWTGACYTTISRSDLRTRGFKPSGAKIDLGSKLDQQIAAEFGRHGGPDGTRKLTCCYVDQVP